MAHFDLILLALIAVFIFLRLRSVLGSRDGSEEQRNHRDAFKPHDPMDEPTMEDRDNVIQMPGTYQEVEQEQPAYQAPKSSVNEIAPNAQVQAILDDIANEDHSFDQHGFADGARYAFEMIITAFADDDRETLKNLLANEVYDNFVVALDARKAAGETMENTLVGINSIEITDASLENSMAAVSVKIVSEQVNVTKDSDGEIVDGDNNYIDTITDIWTFERDTTSQNPNWYLSATQTE